MYMYNYELWGVAGCNPWKSIGCSFVKCKNGIYFGCIIVNTCIPLCFLRLRAGGGELYCIA